jgi:hypothetical protein
LMLETKTANTSGDNPNWKQAMNGPFADEYWEAACTEVETLEKIYVCMYVYCLRLETGPSICARAGSGRALFKRAVFWILYCKPWLTAFSGATPVLAWLY